MWNAIFMLAAAGGPSVVDAELRFAALAQRIGQWTAFRATAARDAVLLIPGPVGAQGWLKSQADPKKSVTWQPSQAFESCDRSVGATIGPWQRPASVGYFATIWTKESGQWRWKVDLGDVLKSPWPIPKEPVAVRRASCAKARTALLPKMGPGSRNAEGMSRDGSLQWRWRVRGKKTHFAVYLWNGRSYEEVIGKVVSQ